MAVAAGTLSRRKKEESRAAAKSKRDKIILAVGGVVLVGVFAVEVLPMLTKGSSSPPPPAPPALATPAPAAVVAVGVVTPATIATDLRRIAKLSTKDPFRPQLVTASTASSGAPKFAHGPAVRAKHFVTKNPFKAQLGAPAQTAAAAPLATPPHVTPASSIQHSSASKAPAGYIVILRSLDSRASAEQEVKKAHAQGLTGASILYSSKYTSLRRGYWVVYLSRYSSMAAANSGLQLARANGYASAYRRPIKK
jgi:hypothetical protein